MLVVEYFKWLVDTSKFVVEVGGLEGFGVQIEERFAEDNVVSHLAGEHRGRVNIGELLEESVTLARAELVESVRYFEVCVPDILLPLLSRLMVFVFCPSFLLLLFFSPSLLD